MKLDLKRASTSNILQIFIADTSSTTGAGLTGLVFNSASLTAYYHRDTDTTATAISLATMTVGTFTSTGFKEIDATNMPGWYQFCPPNAAFATGASNVAFHLKGATNMAPLPIECQLVSYDPYDAVALGLSNLDTTVSSRSTFAGGAVSSVTGNVGGSVASVTSGVTVTTNNDKVGYSLTAGQLFVKKNTALAAFTFPMFDSTNHQMAAGLTVAASKSIDGAALAACTNSVTEISGGLYKIDLTATELNCTTLALKFTATGGDDLPYTIVTQA